MCAEGIGRRTDILGPWCPELVETTDKIGDQHNQENGPEPDPGSAVVSPPPVAVISTASAEEKNQQNNQKQHYFTRENNRLGAESFLNLPDFPRHLAASLFIL